MAPDEALGLVLARLTRPRRSAPSSEQAAWLAGGARHDLDHGGGTLAVYRWDAAPAAPTVLLVHGWESRAGAWHVLGPRLVEAGYGVVAFDAPAHGASTGSVTEVRGMGQAVVAVARRCGQIDAVIAHSLGSPASLYAFAAGLRVRASVHLAGPSSLLRALDRGAALARLGEAGGRALRERFMLATGYAPAEMELARLADGLRHPALLLHDPDDGEVPYADSAALAAAWPHARLAPAAGVGHRRILDDEGVATRAVAFLGRHLEQEAGARRTSR